MANERGILTRRQALIAGGVAAAGTAAGVIIAVSGDDEEAEFPRQTIAGLSDLTPNEPVSFEYPLEGQSSVLVDLGDEVPGGVGDNNSIVAYSALCQHMGCDVQFVSEGGYMLCPCHQSKYDPAREGNVIQGVAQTPLPRIELEIDGGDVVAVGVDGLIYGYRENLAPGEAA
ncbi:MAG: arsenate reductase (azurin) small subunit [Solirubrobacterales bacterium]